MKHPPKGGDYRLVSKGIGLNTVYSVEIRKTTLWGAVGWWSNVWAGPGIFTSKERAVTVMRRLIKDRDSKHPERIKVVATEDTIDFGAPDEPTDWL